MELSDYILTKGDYGSEKQIKDVDALVYMVSNILYNKPGFLPLNPRIGMSINTRKHFLENDKSTINEINSDLKQQISICFPDIKMECSYAVNRDGSNKPVGIITLSGGGVTITMSTTKVSDVQYKITYKDYTK
jgi:hypothetical protein